MIVKDIKNSLLKYGALSLPELAQVTGVSKADISPLINELESKGRLESKVEETFCSSSTCSCSSNTKSLCNEEAVKYKWK